MMRAALEHFGEFARLNFPEVGLMNLTDLAVRFADARWNQAHDAFVFLCPVCRTKKALAAIANGRVALTCPAGCSPDQMLRVGPAAAGRPQPAFPERLPLPQVSPPDREYVIAYWEDQLLKVARHLVEEVKTPEELAEWIMGEAFKNGGPRQALQRPPELKDLSDNELEGIFAFVAQKAWAERLPALKAEGNKAPLVRRPPGLRTVRDYMIEMKSRQERKALIQGLIFEGETVLWVGRAMAGKSTDACAMARC